MPPKNKRKSQQQKPEQVGSVKNYFLRTKHSEQTVESQTLTEHMSDIENKMADQGNAIAEGKETNVSSPQKQDEIKTPEENADLNTKTVTNSDLKNLMLEISETLSKRIEGVVNKLDKTKTSMETKIDSINARIDSMEKKYESFEKKLVSSNDRLEHFEKHTVKEVKDSISSVEAETQKSIEFVNGRVDTMEQNIAKVKPANIEKLEERIKELEEMNQYQEYRSRRYNLLVYGIHEDKDEDTTEVFKQFLINNCKLEAERVGKMGIANCHRIPKNPESDPTYKPGAPNAIIAKFVLMKDRNTVLAFARNLPKGKTVRTDLPRALKTKRAKLAREAYQIRKKENKQTAIRESPFNVWLEVRDNRSKDWEKV